MYLMKPSVSFESSVNFSILELIEKAGRVCYKSEDTHDLKVQELVKDSNFCPEIYSDQGIFDNIRKVRASRQITEKFVRGLIKSGHESVIEHGNISVRFICDRGVTHELVRHRICAYSQESTRYVNYKTKGCQFIIPPWVNIPEGEYDYDIDIKMQPKLHKLILSETDILWFNAVNDADWAYQELIKSNQTPQQARAVLPNSTKTEIVMTCNLRELRHILKLRTSAKAHPQMREIMLILLDLLKKSEISCIFDDITGE